MQSMVATFDSSLPDDSKEIGNRFIQPGHNVASRVQEGLKRLGYPVTDVENYEDFAWYFTACPTGLFRLKPCVGCLCQSEEQGGWLLTTHQSRGSFIFKDDAYYQRVLDDINAIMAADPAFSNLNWLSEEAYTGQKPKWNVVSNFIQFCMALLVIFLATLPQIGFVLAIVLSDSLLANFGSNAAFGNAYWDNHKWPMFLSVVISSAIVWSFGRFQRKKYEPNKSVNERKTANEKTLIEQARDYLVWPMKYFSAIILLIGLLYLVC